jgi:hypothetical protein
MPNPHRLLFASIHSYLDPSSGAALATRELLELLAARDWDCRAFTCGVLDFAHETPLEDLLASIEHRTPPVTAALSRGGNAEVFDLEWNGVRIHSCRRRTAGPTRHGARARLAFFSISPTRSSTASSPTSCSPTAVIPRHWN